MLLSDVISSRRREVSQLLPTKIIYLHTGVQFLSQIFVPPITQQQQQQQRQQRMLIS